MHTYIRIHAYTHTHIHTYRQKYGNEWNRQNRNFICNATTSSSDCAPKRYQQRNHRIPLLTWITQKRGYTMPWEMEFPPTLTSYSYTYACANTHVQKHTQASMHSSMQTHKHIDIDSHVQATRTNAFLNAYPLKKTNKRTEGRERGDTHSKAEEKM